MTQLHPGSATLRREHDFTGNIQQPDISDATWP